MRVWRNHPVLCTALVGAVVGFVIAATLLFSGPLSPLSHRFLLFLFPTSILSFSFMDGSIAFWIFLAIVEIGGNAFLYACAFAAPVAAAIAIRRQFGTSERPTSITET